ncbi:spermatogenesis-associated protein 33 isoform X2 [Phascolarctos cinereus]|uniref:Spermatogenesis-associated protein 33 isoform X2 n=1 Tax=Phascolarctos cinereus TaxID=38626 RepID=A0A6P5KJI7_PHACI|nr:spermatogenesis-associated protein 33 isoform X2 [Phascolarctos cinereus]
MNPLMGLNKSKGPSDKSSSSVRKHKSKSRDRHADKRSTSSRPSSSSNASSAHGSIKTSLKSPRSISETGKQQKSKTFVIPQIIVTRASTDLGIAPEEDVQKTIRDQMDYGPYYRHRNPSTVDAYTKTQPEAPKTKSFV